MAAEDNAKPDLGDEPNTAAPPGESNSEPEVEFAEPEPQGEEGREEEPEKCERSPGEEAQEPEDGDETEKSSKLDKVLQRLQGQGSAEHSRESSPDPKDANHSGRQSRRKPKVTRKVIEDEEGSIGAPSSAAEPADVDMVDAAMDLAIQEFLNSAEKDPNPDVEPEEDKASEKDSEVAKEEEEEDKPTEAIDLDEDGNLILPEGTVVVEPEAVSDNKPVFKGPEFRSTSSKKSSVQTQSGEIDLNNIHCSACNHQINTNHANSVKRHPVLKVILCKRCYNWYASDEILQDKDGMDEQCRWCGEGGDLLCCDYCHNAFCKGCIRRNLGRGELSDLLKADEDSKWHCYVCDPKPLAELIYNCNMVIEAIEKNEDKRKEREKKIEEKKKKQPQPSPRQGPPQKPNINIQQLKQAPPIKGQAKPTTVFNLLANQRGSKLVQGTTPTRTVPQKGQQQNTQQAQAAARNVFIEWNFRINESNVMPIIDRAMMVTESMHMLLSSLREDIQRIGSFSSQRTMTKADSANKLKRALTAFNKSFFDLSLFSQKTSSATVRQIMEDQGKLKPQPQRGQQIRMPLQQQQVVKRGGNNPVRPVQLVQHGQKLVMLPSGNTVLKGPRKDMANMVKNPALQQKQTVKIKPKQPTSGKVEYIELLDSDDESKSKSPPKKDKGDDKESGSKRGFQLKVALGGPGHKLKGPLSKRKKVEEQEKAMKAKAAEEAETVEEKETEKIESDDEAEKGIENVGKDEEPVNKSSEVEEDQADDEDKDIAEKDATGGDEHMADEAPAAEEAGPADTSEQQVMDVDEDNSESKDKLEPDGEQPMAESPTDNNSAELDDFKTIEEQLKQLNGGYGDELFSNSDADNSKLDTSGQSSSKGDGEKIIQLDGAQDNYDSSSDEDEVAKDASSNNDMFSSLRFEPLFNLDDMSNTDSSDGDAELPGEMYDLGNGDCEQAREGDEEEDDLTAVDGCVDEEEQPEDAVQSDAIETEDPMTKWQAMDHADNDDDSESISGDKEHAELMNTELTKSLGSSPKDGSPRSSGSKGTSPKGNKRSRADIEAQRLLHKELLDIDSDEEEGEQEQPASDEDTDLSSSEGEEETSKKSRKKTKSDSEDEYKPGTGKSQAGKRTRGKGGKGKQKGKKDLRCIVRTSQQAAESSSKGSSSSESEDERTSKAKSKKDKPIKLLSKDSSSSDFESTEKHSRNGKDKDDKGSEASEKPVSDNFDSDLEKDIENLSKMPKMFKGKKSKKEKGDKSSTKEEDEAEGKKKNGKEKEASRATRSSSKKTPLDLVAELSSGEDNDPQEEDAESVKGNQSDADSDFMPMIQDDEDKDEKARKALLAIGSSDGSEDSDMDLEEGSAATRKNGRPKTTRSQAEEEEDDDSEDILPSKRRLRTSLLDAKISDSDSDVANKKKRKSKKAESLPSDSDSDFETSKKKKKGRKKKKGSSSSSEDLSSSESEKKGKKKKRKRVKMGSDSSEASGSDDEAGTPGKKRKKIRKIMKDKKLSESTISAAKAEEDRRKRVEERQAMYNQTVVDDENSPTKCPITTRMILEKDEKTDKVLMEINPRLVQKLKPHQVEAVRFMWDCLAETIERLKKEEGGGCILAHCMGLGKTLSVISFLSTVMKPKKTKLRTALVVCPLNTVLNWQSEFDKWLSEEDAFDVWEMSSIRDNYGRSDALQDWQESGGIMIIGYEMYRNLTTHRNIRQKKIKKVMTETLVDPGPDIIVCDEGHILKNDASALSKAITKIKTKRRIVLTGTPLQNNLVEYHCMVDFVKPNLLGSRKEFTNRFVNPITNGQCSDSTSRDVKVMKHRAHILHDKLAGCVQRRDYSALTKFLMPKHEYIVSVRLAPIQMDLYQKYLDKNLQSLMVNGRITNKGASLFKDYQYLMKIWTHPWALKLDEIRQEHKRMMQEDSESSFLNDDSSSESEAKSTSSSDNDDGSDGEGKNKDRNTRNNPPNNSRGPRTRGQNGDASSAPPSDEDEPVVSREWWAEDLTEEDQFKTELGGKLVVLAEILKMCESIGDKVLVFSQSLLSLDLIENFLEHWDQCSRADPDNQVAGSGKWVQGIDYYRMDGSTSAQKRQATTKNFNDADNPRMRLFLISTKAGSLGINLVSANRVIVFDASWNPTHDIQSIFRVYRFGQEKPVYVYRFLAQGTMEEKIYERQVTKQSLSQRVVDEHQIERHFSTSDLQELYNFKPDRLDAPDREERPIPKLPKDRLLAELLTSHKDWIANYHEHDSLLENIEEETLTEEERKAAWEEYEAEKQGLIKRTASASHMANMYAMYAAQQNQANQGSNLVGMVPEAEQLARAIYAANPGITQEVLQQKVHMYLQTKMDQQRMLMAQRQHEQRMQAEVMKLQQLRLQRYRQQQYLTQMAGGGSGAASASGGDQNYSALMQQLAGTSSRSSGATRTGGVTARAEVQRSRREEAEEPEEGEVTPVSLLDMLRKGVS